MTSAKVEVMLSSRFVCRALCVQHCTKSYASIYI